MIILCCETALVACGKPHKQSIQWGVVCAREAWSPRSAPRGSVRAKPLVLVGGSRGNSRLRGRGDFHKSFLMFPLPSAGLHLQGPILSIEKATPPEGPSLEEETSKARSCGGLTLILQ